MRASSIKKSFIAAGVAAIVAIPALALAQLSTTANGPYYATPSWDQTLTVNRFVILANMNSQAVLDRETGLVWQRYPGTGTVFPVLSNWTNASLNCASAGTGGRYGWRLPTYHELSSLADSTGILPNGHPFQLGDVQIYQNYWSTTISPSEADFVFVRNVVAPVVIAVARWTLANTWCVRGGQGVNTNPN